jgi:hypothetical protein
MATVADGDRGLVFGRADPLDRFFRATHVVRHARGDVRRKAIVFILITWCPLATTAVIEWLATGHVERLFRDLSVHVRFLVAVPLVLLAESILADRCDHVLDRLRTRVDAVALHRIIRRCRALRGSGLIDVALLGLAFVGTHVAPQGLETTRGGAAHLWYGVVALPLASFLLLRVSWSWIVWSFALASLARVDLHANALHPDRRGGLRFLSLPTSALVVLVAAISVVVSAVWATQVMAGTKTLSVASVAPSLAVLIAGALVVAVGPLLPFAGQLYRARLDGALRYDELAASYTDAFGQRWMRRPPDDSLLGSGDIQSLADLGNAYEVVKKMQLIPFGLETVVPVVVAVLLPMLPLALSQVPLYEVLKKLLSLVLGRRGSG